MRKKLTKKDYIYLGIIITFCLSFIFILLKNKYVFGSMVDWNDQHFNIPDYFRKLFYSTHNLIPSFGFNIGSGENIFNLAYYGLLSPIILISYLLPFIPMAYYIMGISVVFLIASIILFYNWLLKKYDSNYAFIGSLLFLCSSPLIYHFHHHIMFVNYMPFMIMGLYGVDKYFEKGKSWLLILAIFLIIMTSFYYSVGSIIGLLIYGIYCYLKKEKKVTVKGFFKEGFKYLKAFIVPIMMSMILLLPTIYALFNGRTATDVNINILSLLIPKMDYTIYLYFIAGLGLSSILYLALCGSILSKKKENKFLAIVFLVILLVPIFVYVLNGLMYVTGKALIPLIPIAVFIIVNFIFNLEKISKKDLLKTICLFAFLGILTIVLNWNKQTLIFLIDFLVILFGVYIYYKFNKTIYLIIFSSLFGIVILIIANFSDNLVLKESFSKTLDDISPLLTEIDQSYRTNYDYYGISNINNIFTDKYNSTTMYSSVANKYYKDFYFNKMGNDISHRNNSILAPSYNLYFNTLMGVKNFVTENKPIGYEKNKTYNGYDLYQNDNVYSIGFATSNVLSNESYNKLSYPYSSEALTKYIVANEGNASFETNIKEINLDYEIDKELAKTDDIYDLTFENEEKFKITLNDYDKSKALIIKFEMLVQENCSLGDTTITINEVSNKLTCSSWKYQNHNNFFEYMILKDKNINLTFSKGHFKIGNVKVYEVAISKITDLVKSIDKFEITNHNGNYLKGNINVTQDGYFMFTIPYDKGFEIKIDGQKINYEKVNEAFIGFPITKGKHVVTLNYTAPLLNVGKMISLVGIGMFIIIIIKEEVKKK